MLVAYCHSSLTRGKFTTSHRNFNATVYKQIKLRNKNHNVDDSELTTYFSTIADLFKKASTQRQNKEKK